MTDPSAADRRPPVLIVEDQPAIAELLVQLLADEGLARDVGARLVLLDVRLPHTSGWTVLEQLRADPATRRTPVVVISAIYDRPGPRPLPPRGPVRFAAKPVDVDALVATVHELIGSGLESGTDEAGG